MVALLRCKPMTRTAIPFPANIPFLHWMGLEFFGVEQGKSLLQLDLKKNHTNSFSVAHGGVQMTLLDVAMAMAARHQFNDDPKSIDTRGEVGMVTIEMKTTFMAPAIWSEAEGSVIQASGFCLKHTAQLAFCEAEITDSRGRLLSKASGTFKAIKQPK